MQPLEILFNLAQVFFRVHTNRVVGCFHHGDANAVFEEAQLLKLLQFFQRRGREMVEGFERRGAERVEPLVFKILRLSRSVAIEGDARAGEIKRPSGKVGHHFHHIRIQRGLRINGNFEG